MTLHWWMHWFWVTLLITLACSQESQAAPQSEELQRLTTDPEPRAHTERQSRAMYFTKSSSTTEHPIINATLNDTEKLQDISNETDVINTTQASVKEALTITPNISVKVEPNTTVAPMNSTEIPNDTPMTKKRNNLTRHPDIAKDHETNIESAAESRIVTEKPLSLETTYLQTRVPENVESSRRVIGDGQSEGMDTGAIAGISFAGLVLAALAGSTAFVLYRRRYLNKPQTLNDKCSNPDSSGYLDDSTIRDNSEEMYSLDNDSFLNSLEAMTIQNYWTDTVKHTKL